MLPIRENNPLAPAAYNGLTNIGPGFEFQDATKLFSVQLTANQVLLNQVVQLDRDADFYWTEVYASPNGVGLRFADQTGYYINDNFIVSGAIVGEDSGIGFVLPVAMRFPAGSAILVDVSDYQGTGPLVSIVFRGFKRYQESQ